jgi:TRAP-type mannitol/chloroaromatic compound transport system substrate-binding protein
MYTSHWSNDSLDSPHLTESFVEVKGYVHKVITALDESLSIISESAQKDNNAKKIFSLMFAYRDSNSSYLNVASETSYSRDYLYSYDEPSIREKLEVQCAIYTIGENK